MSSRPRKISSGCASCIVVGGLLTAVVVGLVFWLIATEEEPQLRPPRRLDPIDRPARNPIEDALGAVPSPTAPTEGTAILVLVDVSGSMDETVLDQKSQPRKKIEIARRSVTSLVRQVEKFAKARPDHRVALGLEEFSTRDYQKPCRTVLPLGDPNEAQAEAALAKLKPQGGTPIGSAVVEAKLKLNKFGYRKNHILVITDGVNTSGYSPADVVNVIARFPAEQRASVYFVAFDIAASQFDATRDAGAIVLGAANETELQSTLDYVLSGKILAEQTGTEPKK